MLKWLCMYFTKVLRAWHQKINKIPNPYLIIAGVVLFLVSLYIVSFREQTIEYSYGGETCQRQLVFMPRLFRASGSDDYTITTSGGVDLWGYPIISTSVCLSANTLPSNDNKPVAISFLGSWLARVSYKVSVPEAPKASFDIFESPIAATKPIVVELSEPDETFSYSIHTDTAEADCKPENAHLTCDIPTLQLRQGGDYVLSVKRSFKDEKTETLKTMPVKTLSPVSITTSSIGQDATVYDRPTTVSLETDKPMKTTVFELAKIDGETRTAIPIQTTVDDKKIAITFSQELERSSQFILTAKVFEATDDSTLLDPYALQFKTSGGPAVTSVNVGSTGVALGAKVAVTFDQQLSDKQDISKIVTVSGGASIIGLSGKQLLISTANVPRCGTFTISITKDLQSNYEIAGNSAWKYTGRTICYVISTIGYSAQGRAINAYYFGSGTTTVLYTGGIHGNEYSSKYLMDAWVNELDRNIQNLPANRRIVVVPLVNPDGFAAKTRNNSRNVDLNRNFDVSDWKSDVTTPSGAPLPGGGGPTPMSEPETQAIASLTSLLRPRLTMSYHSSASYAIGNQAGDSASLAATYASLTGYSNQTGNSSNAFSYEISGTYDDWIAEKLGLPSVLIELATSTNSEFSRNLKALWAMAKS